MELWDIYNHYRQKTNRTHVRGIPLNKGDFHLVVHVWIVNDKGEYLIQKRQPWKKGWPNMWDSSAAGSAIAGDSSLDAIIRETKEELGINLDVSDCELLMSIKFEDGFDDIWLVRQNIDITDLNLQYEEVAQAKWISENELKALIESKEIINFNYFDELFRLVNSKIKLKKASINDADELLNLQKKAFMTIYQKYQDHETSPVNQPKERFIRRFNIGDYYKILYEGKLVGSVFVYEKAPGLMRLHIMNILEEYQNLKIGQEVIRRLEILYPHADSWELETIITEERNCHFYEKMGYVQTKEMQVINNKLTIVKYVKSENILRIKPL